MTLQTLIATVVHGVTGTVARTVPKPRNIIIGAGEGPRLLAGEIGKRGEPIAIVDVNPELCRNAALLTAVEVFEVDPLDLKVLKQAGGDHAAIVLVATPSDELNMAVCQMIEMNCNPARLLVRVNQKANVAEFEVLGYEVMSLAKATLTMLPRLVLNAELRRLLKFADEDELLVDVSITSPVSIARQLSSISINGCRLVEFRRGEESVSIDEATSLQIGDSVTLFGTAMAIETASTRLNPQC